MLRLLFASSCFHALVAPADSQIADYGQPSHWLRQHHRHRCHDDHLVTRHGLRIYVTGVQCGRTDAGTSAIFVTLNDDEVDHRCRAQCRRRRRQQYHVLPGRDHVGRRTALTFTPSSGVTTLYCNAQGYAAN